MDWPQVALGIATILGGMWTAWLTWKGVKLKANQEGLFNRVKVLEHHVKECQEERDSMKALLHEPVPSDVNEVILIIERIRAATKGMPKDIFSEFNIEMLAKSLVARRTKSPGTV